MGINHYISDAHQELLVNADYQPAAISVRHLLTHTSGIVDYAGSEAFYNQVMAKPQRYWTRTEQVALGLACGKPYGPPGEVYRYSDTGYILLGEIIEQVSGYGLAVALRQLLDYARLGLDSTWLETVEPQPEGVLPRICQYNNKQDFSSLNGSNDIYGGGGLVSTIKDMARFMRALFSHQLFDQPGTLDEMLTTVPAKTGGPDYGSHKMIPGAYRLGIDGGLQGKMYQHSGYYGTYMGYIPSLSLIHI